MAASGFLNRIVHYGEKPASDFTVNAKNWRQHPAEQKTALNASLSSIGWVGPVVENRRTGRLIDGHERLDQALACGPDTLIPFIQIDVDETEEDVILASFDAITQLAVADAEALQALLDSLQDAPLIAADDGLRGVLDLIQDREGVSAHSFDADDLYGSMAAGVRTEGDSDAASITFTFYDEDAECIRQINAKQKSELETALLEKARDLIAEGTE